MSLFETVIPSLQTATPAEGRELAILLARKTIATIQPDASVRDRLRPDYAESSTGLMDAARIVALEFQTIAAANNYWRS